MILWESKPNTLKYGKERWQTETAVDLGQVFHCFPFPYVWKASPFNRDDEKSSKPHKTVTVTQIHTWTRERKELFSINNIQPLKNGTTKTILL